IAALSVLYSCSPSFGKSTPILASINHLVGGALHFLLGYTLSRPLDASGLIISLFFGLVFAAGHLNQQVRDYEGDLINGIRTSAVVFGGRRGFLASLFTFTAAYAILAALAALGLVPGCCFGALSCGRCMLHGLCERSIVDWDSTLRCGCNDGIACSSH